MSRPNMVSAEKFASRCGTLAFRRGSGDPSRQAAPISVGCRDRQTGGPVASICIPLWGVCARTSGATRCLLDTIEGHQIRLGPMDDAVTVGLHPNCPQLSKKRRVDCLIGTRVSGIGRDGGGRCWKGAGKVPFVSISPLPPTAGR